MEDIVRVNAENNARKDGAPCIAIMKGDVTKPGACCGIIFLSELSEAMNSSPYIDLDNRVP